MKTHTSKDGLRRIWYDTHLRLWTMQRRDCHGEQVGDVDYTADRSVAFNFLTGEDE